MMGRVFSFLMSVLLVSATACNVSKKATRQTVADNIKSQTGFDIASEKKAGKFDLPPAVQPSDGITIDEAVSIALWNNAQFQADLVSVKLYEADVIDAGVISNPLLRYLAPAGGIAASGYINFGFDFLFQRPKRIAAAKAELERIAQSVTQKGYTLIRDVQVAYIDLLLSREKARILYENAQVRKQMTELANSRLRAGDISELEATTFRADSAAALDELIKAKLDALVRWNALANLLSFSPDTAFAIQSTLFASDTEKIRPENYLELAAGYQPDVKAAALAIEAAGKKLGWEQSRILTFTGTLNYQHLANKNGSKWLPNAANPGIQLEIPVLNRNQGKIARAKADLELASFQYIAALQRIQLDAANTFDRYEQNWTSFHVWENEVLPSLQEAVRLSQSSYRNGDISYLPVLEAMRQLLNAELRKAELSAEIKKTVSQLNLLIGNKWNR